MYAINTVRNLSPRYGAMREIVLPILFWVLVVCMITAVMTGFWMHNFASDCADGGGTYLRDGGTVSCHY